MHHALFRGELRENAPGAFNELSDHFRRGLDLLYQADTLPCEEIHGLKVPGGIGCGRKSHEAQERHGLTANLRLAGARLVGPLLAATRLFRQPAFDKRQRCIPRQRAPSR